MPNQINDTASIALFQKIPLILTATSKATGQPVPGAIISNVVWSQDNEIGEITPTSSPNQYLFTPTKAGVVNITAKALITTP
jgi:hypothetical protein